MSHEGLTIVSAFFMGLFSAPHCAAMCGGIVGALSMQQKNLQASTGSLVLTQLNYNLGRITSYALLGVLFGLIGMSLQHLLPILSQLLRVLAACLMIAMGLYIAGWWMGLRQFENLAYKLWLPLQQVTAKSAKYLSARHGFVAGTLWGCLPCGLVYTALALAMTTGNVFQGSLLMISFGLGTLPTLMLAGIFSQRLAAAVNNKALKSAMGAMIIFYGVWTLLIALATKHAH